VPGRQLLEGEQLERGRILGVDDVDAGDARVARRRAAIGARVARQERELAPRVDVHVLVLPEGRARARRVALQAQLVIGDLVEQARVGAVGEAVGLEAEAPGDEHHVDGVLPAPVGEEVDRRRVLGLRQVVDQPDVLHRPRRLLDRRGRGRRRERRQHDGRRHCTLASHPPSRRPERGVGR
jgi:hypothetical protein